MMQIIIPLRRNVEVAQQAIYKKFSFLTESDRAEIST